MYADLWDGLANYSVAGLTLPASGAVLAVNYVRLGVPDIGEHPDYTQLANRIINGDTLSVQEYLLATGAAPRGIFGDNESAVFFTFAKNNHWTLDFGWSYFQIPLEIPLGASIKLVSQKLGEASGSGIGADFGGQIKVNISDVFWEKWKGALAFGINYQDATRTAVDWGSGNKDAIPANFRRGLAFIQKLPGKDSKLTLSFDAEKRWDYTEHWGVEYQFQRVLALRGGLWGDEVDCRRRPRPLAGDGRLRVSVPRTGRDPPRQRLLPATMRSSPMKALSGSLLLAALLALIGCGENQSTRDDLPPARPQLVARGADSTYPQRGLRAEPVSSPLQHWVHVEWLANPVEDEVAGYRVYRASEFSPDRRYVVRDLRLDVDLPRGLATYDWVDKGDSTGSSGNGNMLDPDPDTRRVARLLLVRARLRRGQQRVRFFRAAVLPPGQQPV